MKFGYTIVYVPDVPVSLKIFELAFGIESRFLQESGDYGELETGVTVFAFAAHGLGHMNLPAGHVEAHSSTKPLGIKIALVRQIVRGLVKVNKFGHHRARPLSSPKAPRACRISTTRLNTNSSFCRLIAMYYPCYVVFMKYSKINFRSTRGLGISWIFSMSTDDFYTGGSTRIPPMRAH